MSTSQRRRSGKGRAIPWMRFDAASWLVKFHPQYWKGLNSFRGSRKTVDPNCLLLHRNRAKRRFGMPEVVEFGPFPEHGPQVFKRGRRLGAERIIDHFVDTVGNV